MRNDKLNLSIFRNPKNRSTECLSLDQLIQYAERAMPDQENLLVEQHLQQCEFCSAALDGLALIPNKIETNFWVQEINTNVQSKISLQNSKSGNWKRFFAIAAVFLISIMAVYYLISFRSNQNVLFAEYFQPYPNTFPIVRSRQSMSEIQFAMQQYELENYETALDLLDEIAANDSQNLIAVFYSGICFLKMNKVQHAIENFLALQKFPDSEFFFPAGWYLALSYLKNKNNQKAKQILIQLVKQGENYSALSQELLQKIK